MRPIQFSLGTKIRLSLAFAGGMLTTIALTLYHFFLVRTPLDPVRIEISDPLTPFVAGAISVWLLPTPLQLFPKHHASLPHRSIVWMKRGMLAGTLACFLTGLLLSLRGMITGLFDGTVQINTSTPFNYLAALLFEPLMFSFLALLVMGIPALATGALSGFFAERIIRRLSP